MRYGKDQKQATRERILEAAGRRFKQDGIDGAGVAALMADAGLTNGAFYAHFDSKEDLVANVLADQLHAQRQSVDAESPDREGLEAFIRSYLSPEHRDQAADGCPSAALLDEIARRPAATRQVFTDELMGVIDDIAARLDPTDVAAARVDALTIFGLMVGTLQLARTLTHEDLSDQLLARGVETALTLLHQRLVAQRSRHESAQAGPRRSMNARVWSISGRVSARWLPQISRRSRTASRTTRRISSERGVGPRARAIITAPTIALRVTVARLRVASSSSPSSCWRCAR
jgi:TetR/AcrR family transcriptional regulator, transcriptional repressor for nem operon